MAEMKFLRKRYMEKRCHMIGPYHYQARLGRWVGEAFTLFAWAITHPPAQFSLIVDGPYHVTPLFRVSFSQKFHFCHYILVKFL